MALCCFHAERNPSLSISIDKGDCKCHAGCGAGGMMDFEKKFSGCDDHTAIAHIAEIVGSSQLMIPAQAGSGLQVRGRERARLF